MNSAVAVQNGNAPIDIAVVEKVITGGDLGQLTPEQRVRYYIETCDSLKLNWKTKPFDVVSLRGNGPKILYPNKGCAEQLAGIHNVSVDLLEAYTEQGVRIQKAKACLANGRCVTKTGAVTVDGLRGDNYANAVMKCETKAHRRAVLALVGLNMPDESELETIPGSQRFTMDVVSGDIAPQPSRASTAPTRAHTATPVVEVVNADTGEIKPPAFDPATATQKQIKAEITRLRSVLGWTENDTAHFVDERGFNLKTREGNLALIAAMQEYVDAEFGDDDEDGVELTNEDAAAYNVAQGTLLDADTVPIEREY